MSTVCEAIERRSSTRGYTAEPVTEEELAKLLEAGLRGPTASNRQEVRFTVFRQPAPILDEIEAEKNRLRGIQDPPHNFYFEAPLLIFLTGDGENKWSALDAGIAKLDTEYPAPAWINIGNADVSNINDEEWESLTLQEALAYSANTVFAPVGTKLGASSLVNYARAFGYGSDGIGQDFTTVASLMPEPSEMTEWETAWAACGQPVGEHPSPAGPQTTVMQNAVMVAAIANGGIAMNPYVVDHILSPEGVAVSSAQPRAIGQPISGKTAKSVKEAMVSVVEEGTGWAAQIEGVRVAGKTGTAETSSSTANSLFVGFAPYDQPTLAISICIEGSENTEINGVATRIAGQVLATCLNIQARGA